MGRSAGLPACVRLVAFALLAWRLPPRSTAETLLLAAWLVFAGAGILLAAIDPRMQRLPTNILVAVAVAVAVAAVSGSLIIAAALVSGRLTIVRNPVIAAAVLGLAHLALALLTSGKLGMGDVRLAALSGSLLGTDGSGSVVLGVALPWVMAALAATVLLRTRRVRRGNLA